ncbi:hypothetical protein CEP54_014895 [Fusarium duplospermum]|uniref:Uncharacterized protein n=1 Tax=Fusarium duplospermum TaxID=1325734 RepID=A0A428NT28_9HYPO|nr:hypothetical protein CEP54_014895 [Fusarium duplospermum]
MALHYYGRQLLIRELSPVLKDDAKVLIVLDTADKEDKFWSCINEKGDVVLNKPVWSEEQIQRVRDHTWKVIDDALNM